MNKKIIFSGLILLLVLVGGIFQYKKMKSQESSMPAFSTLKDMTVENAYAFATAPNAETGAAFMTIKNPNQENERLLSARSKIAEITEIHENIIDPDDGKMMMRKIKSLDIPAEGTASLQPKGYHIMFIQLKEPLKIGESVPLTVSFENTGEQIIDVPVIAPGTNPSDHP